jgi:hypothetical protein
VEVVDGVPTQPYNFDSNIFYFSLSWGWFTNVKDIEKKSFEPKKTEWR